MKKVRIISAEEAALLVNDGDTISTLELSKLYRYANNLMCAIDMTPTQLYNWMSAVADMLVIGEDGKVYILDWAHAAIGNASADAAMTYLQFALEDQKKADLYLKLFCKKNDIAMQYVQRWLPIVAAAQMTKKHGEEKAFLTGWTQVVEFE